MILFTIYFLQIYFSSPANKHFHDIAQIIIKFIIIMEICFQGQTIEIRHQNYQSTNQRNYLLLSCFTVVNEISLSLSKYWNIPHKHANHMLISFHTLFLLTSENRMCSLRHMKWRIPESTLLLKIFLTQFPCTKCILDFQHPLL